MAVKGKPTRTQESVEIKTRPVRVDLKPPVHKALRKQAADEDMSMAALARKIISEHLGFKDDGR
jgi:hypothetical protein